ncbi:Nuclease precursor [Piscirickettsia salmonis]|uniref:Endonuclease n=1 Tax=Piscirickettsia salmonis TaxID=1238 RepID=A0AAC8ZP49_PISSA|nr:DNA/RNA non-specific endonuclease [Piscirickettsia salmonis]AKP73980.1 DNA/RNA endonuclease [Piscirickettsia salmonis LF-89 = ATCC VR-1361]ALB22817.1 DNA/RNA non-specific endonuclease family protein [Piscirickettsia salmonis]ALY02802.1 DNA/RNA endonuclease [Piscirickettsia salmonis]AMA42357.1 DNA/RNA endonuclease [Piscirickettsia salmonis]AOS34825.1 DNA/RNA endonuclease [Piscirickettsia salmonis]
MKKKLLLLTLLPALLQGCHAFTEQKSIIKEKQEVTLVHSNLCLLNTCPTGYSPKDQIINHKIIILANNPKSKFADWVAYIIRPDYINGPSRKREWQQDPDLPENTTLPPSAYRGANALFNVDRGHQAPLGSFRGAENYYVTNYLSNITPQQSQLNQGPWNHLENAVRAYAKQYGPVYVITGPYYEKGQKPVKAFPNYSGTLMIPKGYFKVITTIKNNRIYASTFIMPQTATSKINYCDTTSSLEEVYKLTQGLTVLAKKPVGNLNKLLGCSQQN